MPKEDLMLQKVQCVIRGAGQQVDFSDAKFLFTSVALMIAHRLWDCFLLSS